MNNTSVVSINFHPRQPQHFTAAFADSTILQFNLFAEDPITSVSNSPFPWVSRFETHPNANNIPGGEGSESSDESMMVWKNEDWAQLLVPQAAGGKRKEGDPERSPWAGKNPTAAYKVGKKAITGEFTQKECCEVKERRKSADGCL